MEVNSTKLGREYVIDGKIYYSVTTPLKVISFPHLEVWRARVGKGAANKIAKKASNYGTKIHGYCEDILNGNEPNYSSIPRKYHPDVIAFKEWADENVTKIEAIEEVVINKEIPVAGRVDFIGTIKGYRGTSVCDIKTGRTRAEHWLQLAAYRESYGKGSRRLIISIKNGKVRVIPYKRGATDDKNMKRDWEIYKHVFKLFLWINKLLKEG